MSRIWGVRWEGDRADMIVCVAQDCQPVQVGCVRTEERPTDELVSSGWVDLPGYNYPPGERGPSPLVHAWFDPGNASIEWTTGTLEESVIVEAPEPSAPLLFASGLVMLALLVNLAARKGRR